jgi:hypothetical protein
MPPHRFVGLLLICIAIATALPMDNISPDAEFEEESDFSDAVEELHT